MKKQTLYLIIGTAAMLVVSLVMILVYNGSITDDPYQTLFGEKIEVKNKSDIEDFPGGLFFTYVDYKEVAYGQDGKKLGDIYTVKIRNAYKLDSESLYGTIELLVGIDKDDKVYASIVTLEQSSWTVLGIQTYILETFNGIAIDDVDTLPEFDAADPTAGATATDSTGTIKEAVLKVIQIHSGVVVDPTAEMLARYQGLVSETASFTALDKSTDPTSIVAKSELYDATDTLIGYAIEASTTNGFGLLHLVMVIDTNGDIVAATFVTYANSYFQSEMRLAVQDLVGLSMTDDLTDGFALAAPSSTDTVPSMEALVSDISSAYSHIENGGA